MSCTNLRAVYWPSKRLTVLADADKLAYADLSHVAAASQASTSPVESRRESEVGLAASPDDRQNSTSPGPLTGSGLTAGLGAFGGRWFGGTGRGSISSTMSRNGSQ